jgi:hypothetical protein
MHPGFGRFKNPGRDVHYFVMTFTRRTDWVHSYGWVNSPFCFSISGGIGGSGGLAQMAGVVVISLPHNPSPPIGRPERNLEFGVDSPCIYQELLLYVLKGEGIIWRWAAE